MWEHYKSRITKDMVVGTDVVDHPLRSSSSSKFSRSNRQVGGGATGILQSSVSRGGVAPPLAAWKFGRQPAAQVASTNETRKRKYQVQQSMVRSVSIGENRRDLLSAMPTEVTRAVLKSIATDRRVSAGAKNFAYRQFYLMSIWYLLMAVLYLLYTLPASSDKYATIVSHPNFFSFIRWTCFSGTTPPNTSKMSSSTPIW